MIKYKLLENHKSTIIEDCIAAYSKLCKTLLPIFIKSLNLMNIKHNFNQFIYFYYLINVLYLFKLLNTPSASITKIVFL